MENTDNELIEAKELLQDFEEEIRPFLKDEILYSPADVKALIVFMNHATYFNAYFGIRRILSGEEKIIKDKLDQTINEVVAILDEQEEVLQETLKQSGNILEVEF